MISNIHDESPAAFSQSPQSSQFQYQLETQSSGRKRVVPVKTQRKAFIRDIGFSASDCWYPLASFYKFPRKKQAICWSSITKQEPDPRVNFTNTYLSQSLARDNNPVKILAKTVVLVHPFLLLTSVTPHHIYIPIPSGNEVKFTLVSVKRKPTDLANLEVQVTPDASNPLFSSLIQELSNRRRLKVPARRKLSKTSSGSTINHVKYPKSSQLACAPQQPLSYRVQDPADAESIQYLELPTFRIGSPPPRFPVIYKSIASHPPPNQSTTEGVYEKNKVALGHNCGMYSDNVEACSKCKQPNMGSIFEDLMKQTPQYWKKTPELPSSSPVKSEHLLLAESRKLFHYPFVPVGADSSFCTDNSITINTTDIPCLGDLQYLNDQIMDFWMRHIFDRLNPEQTEKSHVFNTYFYKKLTSKLNRKRSIEDTNFSQSEKRHSRVKNWTKKVDIFAKDFLFIPINENSHWILIVICYPGMVPLVAETDKPNTGSGTPAAENNHQAVLENDFPIVQTPMEEIMKLKSSKSHIKRPCIILFDSVGPVNRAKIFATLREYLQCEHNVS